MIHCFSRTFDGSEERRLSVGGCPAIVAKRRFAMGSFDVTQDFGSAGDNQPSNGILPGNSGALGIDVTANANVTPLLKSDCGE